MLSRFIGHLAIVTFSLATVICSTSHAQTAGTVSTQQESHRLIRANDAITTLGPDMFGDEQNLYTGDLSFAMTDVAVPGNNALPVAVGRRFTMSEWGLNRGDAGNLKGLFGDWDIDLPYLHGVFPLAGWQSHVNTQRDSGTNARCTQFLPPSTRSAPQGTSGYFEASEYWHGNFMYVPGFGDQEILKRAPGNTVAPNGDTTTHALVTRDHWQLSCLPTLAVGSPGLGEGFEARSPSGLRYRFNWMVDRPQPSLAKAAPAIVPPPPQFPTQSPSIVPDEYLLPRKEVRIYATRIEDRFGNYVNFNFDPNKPLRLLNITASDGRILTLNYVDGSDRVQSVSHGTRSWTYKYDPVKGTLTDVIRPDTSRWTYALSNLFVAELGATEGNCSTGGDYADFPVSGSITHPSGAVGTFTVRPKRFGRSWVRWRCTTGEVTPEYGFQPRNFNSFALTQKQITGLGLVTPQTWTYTYDESDGCWDPATQTAMHPAPASELCNINSLTTRHVQVKSPEGRVVRYEFGTRYEQTEGQIEAIDHGLEQNNVFVSKRRVENDYIDPSTQTAFPDPVGVSIQERGDSKMASRLFPKREAREGVSGVQLTWTGSNFDRFGHAKTVLRQSSLGFSKTEYVTYHDNEASWVLGQTKTITNSATGQVELEIGYDAATALPTTRKVFGRLDATMTHNANGLLATSKDGGNKITSFTNYKRGIPQTVSFHDGTLISGTVSDEGWVKSYVDELGNTTTYGYDVLGRLNTVAQPTGDTVAWAGTAITFAKVIDGTNYGFGSTYWKQSVVTGNYRKETMFDALWRPVLTKEWDNANATQTQRFSVRRFDSDGREVFTSYPVANVVNVGAITQGSRQQFDELGRLLRSEVDSEQGVLGTGIEYLSGFQKRITNPRGKKTTIDFMVYDEASEELPVKISAPEGVIIEIERDAYGKPKWIKRRETNPGVSATRHYVYDIQHRRKN